MTRSRSGFLGVIALLAGGLAAYSCGGSSSSTSPTPVGGGGGTGGTATAADVTITITGMNGANSFSPSLAQVAVGQTVAWHNADSIGHTAVGHNFDTGVVAPGATSAPIQFKSAATFDYRCTIHPSMTGTVTVGGSTTRVGY